MGLMERLKEKMGLEEYRKLFEDVQALRFYDGGNCVAYVAPNGEKTEINFHVPSSEYRLCNGHIEPLARGLKKVDIYGFEKDQRTFDLVDKTRKRGLILRYDKSTLFLNLQADCIKSGTDVTGRMALGLKSVLEAEIAKNNSSTPIEKPHYLPEGVAASA